jgi:chromosome segregation ATPase
LEGAEKLTQELDKQCLQRTNELTGLENENKVIKVEISELVQTIERLAIERSEMEERLEGIKTENAKLVSE